MRCYILFGPGKKNVDDIIHSNLEIDFRIVHQEDFKYLSRFFNDKIDLIIISQYIHGIPLEILCMSTLVYYSNNKNFDISNKEVLRMYYSKYDYIKTFISKS